MPLWLTEIVPRFVTEDCAVTIDDTGTVIDMVRLVDVDTGERFDRIVPIRCLAWLGFGFFCRDAGPDRPFEGG
ncbi:hypothetical protein [Halomonas sp. NO4]|uniref:hypothetical protein n=1 Tax=Halomonas sp. NO4 TaxID=2484813 RepID=UPI0013CF5ECD|nr:hypothetical protein [Halomonas sp. NO4]